MAKKKDSNNLLLGIAIGAGAMWILQSSRRGPVMPPVVVPELPPAVEPGEITGTRRRLLPKSLDRQLPALWVP